MSSSNSRFLKIEITANSSHPELLAGLEAWLSLGLLTDVQVKQISRQYLTCPLPEVTETATVPAAKSRNQSDFAIPVAAETATRSTKATTQEPANRVNRILQSLMAELSVRWLLFLGVFMVVVSSGLLAATQWEKFPSFGQYGILLSYTLIFWLVSFWAGKQSNLQLTAQTLQAVTLCLVPVNFWAMDGFRLWGNIWEWLTVAIASVTLTGITILILKTQRYSPNYLGLINYLGLSYLHWGWGFSGFPLIAVYLGVAFTSLATVYTYRDWVSREESAETNQLAIANSQRVTTAVIYGIAVLLIRAIFLTRPPVEITQLGLAIGICGWLLAWLSQQRPNPLTSAPPFSQVNWEVVGGVLLFVGWAVSVIDFPGQALAVSGIGLWFFDRRLKRFWRKFDLAAFLLVGFQSIWLVWRLVPDRIQQVLVNTALQLTGAESYSYTLLGVVLFPYVVFIVGVTNWLEKRQKPELVKFGEGIALILGLTLTIISLLNPLLRSLNLISSTITLAVVTQKRPRTFLIYLTHIFALLTITSFVDYLLPNLNVNIWMAILQGLMVTEWIFSISNLPVPNTQQIWQRSSWHLGLSLAALTYVIPLNVYQSNSIPSLLWLITPLALTGVATWGESSRRELAAGLSLAANILAQVLLFPFPETRLFGLALATMLMFVNTRYLQNLLSAVITIGFGLSFSGQLLWDRFLGFPRNSIPAWLIALGVVINLLWLCRGFLLRKNNKLSGLYAQASDGWASNLSILELLLLTFHSASVYSGFLTPSVPVLIAIILTFIAIAYRNWQQPTNLAIFALAWSLELLTAEIIGFTDRSLINLSIANIALGLTTQLLGDWWRRKVGAERFPVSLHLVPLIYGILAGVLRWGNFASWTGLSSMAISLIAIGVGRRKAEFKPLLYLGLFGVSASAYELLLYQLSQSETGGFGDGLIAMAALGTGIMYAYRVLSPWLLRYLPITTQELKRIAHLHWVWSSFLLMFAIINPIQSGRFIGLGVGLFLVQYAILQGRNNPNLKLAESWVYLGLIEAAAIRFYWQGTPVEVLFSDPLKPFRVAIACLVAYFFYILPWSNWGWPKRPWLIAAIVWPLVIIWETSTVVHPVSLLIAAGFYTIIAWLDRQIRFSYISVALINWTLWRWFLDLQLTNALWYVIPVGLTLLYIAQVDPDLNRPEQRENRHYLRCLGIGTICLVSLWTEEWTGIGSGILSIVVIFAGLALRVRAFLYIGTITFLINAFNQLVILNFRYSFFKWLIGLVVGIVFIWIAANFETRREQLTTLLRNWITELQNWE
ncbi:hypothetical protein ACE1B6_27785 [Aerosakkonemataceae cyanobacterium BLCC-F154]|uniref:DUF2157 domain-containing protein n=1 Tax=Floridaenema fluviatile BLCC-F154 TaxID=3153640 RepID=A0ABV4YK00_9CYAN